MTDRPQRVRALDELGQPKSLPCGPEDFLPLLDGPAGAPLLLLGLGPEPERLPELLPDLAGEVPARFIEAPELAEQLGTDWQARIPGNFSAARPEEVPALAQGARVLLYRPGPRLFPGFWGPLLARLKVSLLRAAPEPAKKLVWLPGGAGDLLRLELAEAFEALGWRARVTGGAEAIPALLAGGECPSLCLSVNFSGIDPLGEAAHLLKAAGARLAVWCVDNPLHLVSGLKARFWTALPLFVTDDWFLDPLGSLGARYVRQLPLAARAVQLAGPPPESDASLAELAERLVFVGRSAFPGKADFFAGCTLPAAAWTEAERLLAGGSRPDFGWWLTRLGVTRLWPGADARRAGYCAEESGRVWRTACLARAASDLPGALTVYGPEGGAEAGGWQGLLEPGVELRGPLDYYTGLPAVSRAAGACLCCTSPLLPRGLTQRHFDVWASGGLLLTDATPGLEIFPRELTRAVTFRTPEGIAPLFRSLAGSPEAAELKAAWRAELAARHTYVHRVERLLDALNLNKESPA